MKCRSVLIALITGAMASCGAAAPVCAQDLLVGYDESRSRFVIITPDESPMCPSGSHLAIHYTKENEKRTLGCWQSINLFNVEVKFDGEPPAVYEKTIFFRKEIPVTMMY